MTRSKTKRRITRERLPRASKAAVSVQARRQERHSRESVSRTKSGRHTSTHPSRPHHARLDPQVQIRPINSEEVQAASAANVDHSSRSRSSASPVSASKHAPPTDTPTPQDSDPSSKVTAAPEQTRQSSSMSTNRHDTSGGVSTCPKVGLLKAQSPWLRKNGVCIAVFEDKSVSQLLIINEGRPSNYCVISFLLHSFRS